MGFLRKAIDEVVGNTFAHLISEEDEKKQQGKTSGKIDKLGSVKVKIK